MKCDLCGEALSSASIICRKCNNNNAGNLVSHWRAKQSSAKKVYSAFRRYPITSTLELVESPTTESAPVVTEMPLWRLQVKEKVRQLREKRQAQAAVAVQEVDEALLGPNPIVEAALNRIRRQSQTPSIPPPARPARRGPIAAAVVEALTLDPIPHIEISHRAPRVDKTRLKAVEQVNRQAILPSITPAEPDIIPEKITTIPPSPEFKQIAARKTPISWDVIPETFPRLKSQPAKSTRDTSRSRVTTQVIELPPAVSELTNDPVLPATLWLRTLAAACDYEIVAMAYLPIFAAFAMFNTSIGSDAFFILFLLLSAIVILYQSISLFFA